MTDTGFEPIARFMSRVRRANASGGKSVNLTIEEASELTAAMGLVLLAKLQSGQPTATPEVEEIVIQGGSFK